MMSDAATTPEHASIKAELEARLRFETLLADLSAKLINLPAAEIDHQIEDSQRLVCESLGLDLATLWQWRPDNPRMLRLTHLYRPLGGPPVPDPMDSQESFPWCQGQVLAGKTVAVSSMADLPPEAARDREVWSHYGIKTALTIPLSAGGGPVFGAVSFNDMRTERRWSGALVQRLQLVAQIFANALARKVTDQALRESEARLSLAADAAAMGLWSLNLATDRFWLTDKTRELFDFAADEVVTFERFLSLVHPDDQSPVRETVRTMLQAKSEGQVQYRTVWPDGRVRWMLSRGRVRCGASGEPEYLMGVTADITERKLAEEQLAADLDAMTRLHRLGTLFVREGSLEPVLGEIVETAIAIAKADFGGIQLLDPKSSDLHIVAQRGFPRWWLEFWDSVAKGKGTCGTAMERGERVIVEDVERSPIFIGTPALEIQRKAGVRAVQSTPLVTRAGTLVGMFSTHYKAPHRPDERTLRLLDLLARQAADIIERTQTGAALRESEHRLRESESRYRGIFDGAIEGLFQSSAEGNLVVANAALARMLGYGSAEEAIHLLDDTGRQVWADPDERVRFLQRLEKEGTLRAYECQFKRADGTKFWVSLNARAVRGPDGRVAHLDGFVEDISERKRVADALEKSEDRFRTAFMTGADAYLIAERDTGKMTEVNDRMVALYGYTREEFIGHTSNELGMWVYPEAREEMLKELRKHGRIENLEVYARRKGGEPIWVLYSVSELKTEGTPLILGAIHDITDRKRAETALRESEERFRQVAEIAGEFIWEVDATGVYTYASPSVEKILGYSPEELVGKKHFYDLFDPSVREELKAAAFQAFADRQTLRGFPNPNISKSGKIVHLETSGAPVLDTSGNIVGYRGADTDVTERKRSEQEIAQQRSQLTHLSRVNMLGELAGSLAHELNQPLTAVLSNAQAAQRFLAHDPPDLNEVRDILADIVAEDKRAGEVIHRLRLLLKMGEVQRQPLNVNEIVQEVLKLVRSDLVNHNVTAQTELNPHLPMLYADRVQLQQVLLNLVMNACDAMSGGERDQRQLTICTRRTEDGSVEISVTDSGVGLPPDKLEQVFEPFYTTKPHGMGLGLAVCRTIVTAHGGKLWATNNPGRGATFHVALPVGGKGQGAVVDNQ